MPRPSKAVDARIVEITETLRLGQLPDDISPIEAITGSIRSAIRPPDGYRLVVCDYSAIESRVLGWTCRCEPLLKAFRDGLDPYTAFAVHLFRKDYAQISGHERQMAKPAVLAGGYGQGGPGLVKYAKGMGITLTEEEAQHHVDTFRQTYAAIPATWCEVEQRCKCAIQIGTPAATLRL